MSDLPAGIRAIAAAQVERLAATVAAMSDADLVAPTRCAGWLAAHLLAHVRLGLAEHATAFTDPAAPGEAVDRDYVSYWRDFPATGEPATYADVRFHWASASAYVSADSLRRHFADTAQVAAAASRTAGEGAFRFQGHVMQAADILAMWTVEWVVHQLDLHPAGGPGDGLVPEAVELAARTLDGLTGGTPPKGWDPVAYILKGAGRVALDEADREFLGERAKRFPAFG